MSKCAACVLAATGSVVLTPEAVFVPAPSFVTSDAVWISRENLFRASALLSLKDKERLRSRAPASIVLRNSASMYFEQGAGHAVHAGFCLQC